MVNVRALALALMVAATLPAAASDRIPVVNEGAITNAWGLAPGTHVSPAYPQAYAKDNPQVCLTVGYLLNADGHASDFALLNSWASGNRSRTDDQMWAAFAGNAAQALAQWKFVPKPGVASPTPVYTAATFVYGPGDAAATGAHCTIPDLQVRLVELRHDSRARKLMAGGVFPRLDVGPKMEYEIRQQQIMARESQRQSLAAIQERNQLQQQQPDQLAHQISTGVK